MIRPCLPLGLVLLTASAACAGVPEKPTFTEHVAPIVFRSCTPCHRPGEGAPFVLMSYKDVKKRANLIQSVIEDRSMPPWPPAKGWGHFEDERRLPDEQIRTIARWIEAGTPEGPADKLPALPTFAEGGWPLGKPDLVVTLPESFEVPADGKDIYRMFVLPLDLPEDRYVTAVDIRPTARSVVHHALYFLDSTGRSRELDKADPGPGFSAMRFPRTGSLGGWAVGASARHLPMGLAYPLPKGSDLVVQIHFHPSGKVEHEKTSLALYFAKEKPKKKLLGTQAPFAFGAMTELRTKGIAPGDSQFTIRGEWTVPYDIDLISAGGHAHYLCKTMQATATRPGGQEEKLFAIDDWDFRWQGRYNYAAPVRLPKGTTIRTTLVYDNSAENPRNPNNPPRHVKWGEGSTDEMGSIGFAFIAVNEDDIARNPSPFIFGGGDSTGRLGRGGAGGAAGLGGAFRSMTPEQRKALFTLLDIDQDGTLAGDEIPDRLRQFLPLLDANKDGKLDMKELDRRVLQGKDD